MFLHIDCHLTPIWGRKGSGATSQNSFDGKMLMMMMMMMMIMIATNAMMLGLLTFTTSNVGHVVGEKIQEGIHVDVFIWIAPNVVKTQIRSVQTPNHHKVGVHGS